VIKNLVETTEIPLTLTVKSTSEMTEKLGLVTVTTNNGNEAADAAPGKAKVVWDLTVAGKFPKNTDALAKDETPLTVTITAYPPDAAPDDGAIWMNREETSTETNPRTGTGLEADGKKSL
jgi:hypothetical protein